MFRGLPEAFDFLYLAEDHLLEQALGDTPLEGISWWGGEMLQFAGRLALASPDTLTGRQIATWDGRFRQLGAETVSVPPVHLVAALGSGQVDLVECSLATAETLVEQSSAVTMTNHRFRGWVMVSHRARWQSLDAGTVRAVETILRDAGHKLADNLIESEWQRTRRFQENPRITLHRLSRSSWRAWQQAVQDQNQAVVERSGSIYRSLVMEGFEEPREAALPPPQPPEIFWNGWCETMAQKDVVQLVAGERYHFNLDLSRLIYRGPYGAPAAPAIFEALKREGQISLLLQPVLVGGHLAAPIETPLKPKLMTINWDRLNVATDLDQTIAAFEAGEITVSELARAVNLGPKVSWDLIAQEAGCGIITVSVWNSAGSRPMDHLIFSLPIAPSPGAETDFSDCTRADGKNVQSGLLTLLVDPTVSDSSEPTLVDAALHIYETRGPEQTYSMAVFIDKARYQAAQCNLSVEDSGIYAWQLPSALSAYVSGTGHMLEALRRAHKTLRNHPNYPYPFAEVARELSIKIFSGNSPAQDRLAQQALSSLKSLLAAKENPICLIQLFSATGEMIYFPFGLLSARAPVPVLPKRFQLVQPLTYPEPQAEQACFDRWAIAIPEEFSEAGPAETRLMNLDRSSRTWITAWPANNADLRDFLAYNQRSLPTEDAGIGLILLAHHAEGYIWYNQNQTPSRILLNEIRRPFPRGSVALISACETSGDTPACRALVRKLNQLGIETLIISSVPVDAEFGTHLALEFLTLIQQLRASQSTTSLGRLLENAAERAAARFSENPEGFREMALEFQLVGKSELAPCPYPQEDGS